jgi:hypothetical protein
MTDDYDIANPRTSAALAVGRRRRAPTERRFKISLRSRCTAMLAGLRTLIQTRHGPDWYDASTPSQAPIGKHGCQPQHRAEATPTRPSGRETGDAAATSACRCP